MDKMKVKEAVGIVQKQLVSRMVVVLNAIDKAQIAHGNTCSQVILLRNVYDELLLTAQTLEKYKECWY